MKASSGIGASALPLSTNNRQFLPTSRGGPGILNQHDTGSCEGHAHASAITHRFAAMGKQIPLVSPIGLYTGARMVERRPNPDGSIPRLEDNGTEPSLVIQAMQQWGACSATAWGDYPASSATINDEPNLAKLEAEADFDLVGAYFLQSSGDQFCKDVMATMAAGFGLTSAIAASGSTFQNYAGGVLGALDDAIDHASFWIDYAWDGANLSSLVVYGVNSWGELQWGESDVAGISGGMYRCDRTFISKYNQDCAVIDVRQLKGGA